MPGTCWSESRFFFHSEGSAFSRLRRLRSTSVRPHADARRNEEPEGDACVSSLLLLLLRRKLDNVYRFARSFLPPRCSVEFVTQVVAFAVHVGQLVFARDPFSRLVPSAKGHPAPPYAGFRVTLYVCSLTSPSVHRSVQFTFLEAQ